MPNTSQIKKVLNRYAFSPTEMHPIHWLKNTETLIIKKDPILKGWQPSIFTIAITNTSKIKVNNDLNRFEVKNYIQLWDVLQELKVTEQIEIPEWSVWWE